MRRAVQEMIGAHDCGSKYKCRQYLQERDFERCHHLPLKSNLPEWSRWRLQWLPRFSRITAGRQQAFPREQAPN
jgi:hypothetical protein